MTSEKLRDALKKQPFEAFRIVMTDGKGFDVRHPDLLWIGHRVAHIGVTRNPNSTLFERHIEVDLGHVIRTEPLEHLPQAGTNGPPAPPVAG